MKKRKLKDAELCNGCSTNGYCHYRTFNLGASEDLMRGVLKSVCLPDIPGVKLMDPSIHRRPKDCVKENGVYEGSYHSNEPYGA